MKRFNPLLQRRIQSLAAAKHHIGALRLRGRSAEDVFTEIYTKNKWRNPESRSGPGSTLARTQSLRAELSRLFRRLGIRSLLDIPCGDFNWMQAVDLDVEIYLGADIVSELVDANRRVYGNPRRRFVRLDLMHDPLPEVDLILCRDGLVHFSNANVTRAIENIRRSNSKFLLATTFARTKTNAEIATGQWRPLNLQVEPFCFPAPVRFIDDRRPDGLYPDKTLGLWPIADLP